MPTLEPRELTNQLEQNRFFPLYCLVGEETFMIDEVLEKIKSKVLVDGAIDFNLNTFYATDTSVSAIRDTVEILPMMAAKRLVVVKQAHDFNTSEWDELSSLVENPVDTTVLVFVANKIDMRKKIFKLFETKGAMIKFVKPFENQLTPWIHYIAKKHGKKLSAEASELIRESVGASLTDINNEICKLSQFIGDRELVEVDDVKAVVSHTRVHTVFELVNCMGVGDCAGAFMHLAHLLDNGQNEVGVLAMITRHFRILLLCQEALKEGLSQSQISSRVGVHGFFVREYIEQAKRHNMSHLLYVYDVLLDTDRALKSNPLSSHLWLENLILQACRPAKVV